MPPGFNRWRWQGRGHGLQPCTIHWQATARAEAQVCLWPRSGCMVPAAVWAPSTRACHAGSHQQWRPKPGVLARGQCRQQDEHGPEGACGELEGAVEGALVTVDAAAQAHAGQEAQPTHDLVQPQRQLSLHSAGEGSAGPTRAMNPHETHRAHAGRAGGTGQQPCLGGCMQTGLACVPLCRAGGAQFGEIAASDPFSAPMSFEEAGLTSRACWPWGICWSQPAAVKLSQKGRCVWRHGRYVRSRKRREERERRKGLEGVYEWGTPYRTASTAHHTCSPQCHSGARDT